MAASKKDITDAQVLSQLRIKKLRLQLELERVEIAIRAFENIKEIDPLDAAVYEVEQLDMLEAYQYDLAVSILAYNPKMSAEKKIMYALERINRGDATAISEYLIRIDGHIKNTQAFFNNITYVASRMYKTDKILAVKDGKRNIYYLKH